MKYAVASLFKRERKKVRGRELMSVRVGERERERERERK